MLSNKISNVFPNDRTSCKTQSSMSRVDVPTEQQLFFFGEKWSHFFRTTFSSNLPPAEKEFAVDGDLLFTKLQVDDQKVVTQPARCFHWAKSYLENGMIPLGTELKSRFLRSKLLWSCGTTRLLEKKSGNTKHMNNGNTHISWI